MFVLPVSCLFVCFCRVILLKIAVECPPLIGDYFPIRRGSKHSNVLFCPLAES